MLSAILHTAYTDTRVRKTRAAKGPIKRRTLQHSGEIANAPFSSDLTALMLSLGAGTYSLHRPIHLIDRLDINFAEDVATTGMLVVLMATTHAIVDRLVFRPLSRACVKAPAIDPHTPPPSPSLGKAVKDPRTEYQINLWKFRTSIYKFCAYAALFTLGIWSLITDSQLMAGSTVAHWFYDGWASKGVQHQFNLWPATRIRGDSMPVQPTFSYGARLLNMLGFSGEPSAASPIMFHYQLSAAFYIYSSILLAFDLEGPKQKDKYQMLTHHAITLFLIAFSWYFQLARVGAIILVIHDFADPFMELAKMSLYSGRQLMANLWFAAFSLSFLVTRWILLPFVVIYPCFHYVATDDGWQKAQLLPGWWLPLAGLCGLQALHLFWGSLLIKMVIETLVNGDVGDDIRDEE